ncbi:3-dehydroquinate synthase [Falsibacillus pallidus]|uniref:3-dehydroquinate synthase n=1 Tax=Falsibacillus pallidus TaxID=493781 RepID=A0A370GKV9_9BACI|nr:3-dehydroquinate synthase [Falsibacillus pallidus]RDI42994.1 3-dehydroquinate synthase [Falsibacillus pallidus]
MEEVIITAGSKKYPVYIGEGIRENLWQLFQTDIPDATKIMLITDGNVAEQYMGIMEELLVEAPQVITHIVPSGEHCKNLSIYEGCLTKALENGLDRKSVIIAFGGGAVGDLAGFTAATYMRGIRFIQVPTTILAHDSAVGGKVAVNHPLGKNMIGAFYHPEFVLYDTEWFHSLPVRELKSGFAEAIKHALIADPILLEMMMSEIHAIEDLLEKPAQLTSILKRGIEIKAFIVKKDEKEKGERAFLNFGHTLGHAIEAECGYGNITHGEAVMIGMIYALKLSMKYSSLSFPIASFLRWIQSLGYSIEIDEKVTFERLWEWMARDKKSLNMSPNFVLLKEVGLPVQRKMEKAELAEAYHTLFEG